jgi:thiamine pyrophosphokinase
LGSFRLGLGDYVLIVAGGEEDDSVVSLHRRASLCIAADRGAEILNRYGIVPDVLVGDFDSCPSSVVESCRQVGTEIVTLRMAKDKTDTEVALDIVLKHGFSQAVVAGAFGGNRKDHEIANISLIEMFHRKKLDVVLTSRGTVAFGLSQTERQFTGTPGDWVSLIPVTHKVHGVSTQCLKFPLAEATLVRGSTLGISNEMEGKEALVRVREGFLLIFVSPSKVCK